MPALFCTPSMLPSQVGETLGGGASKERRGESLAAGRFQIRADEVHHVFADDRHLIK